MSNRIVGLIYDRFPGRGAPFQVMLALADIGDDFGRNIWCGNDYLAAKCRLSKRQLIRVIKELKDDGWIVEADEEVRGRPVKSDRFIVNVAKVSRCHLLLPGRPNQVPVFDDDGKVTFAPPKGDKNVAKGDTKNPESAPDRQNPPEPYNHLTMEPPPGRVDLRRSKSYVVQGFDQGESRIESLRRWLAMMEKRPAEALDPASLDAMEQARAELAIHDEREIRAND